MISIRLSQHADTPLSVQPHFSPAARPTAEAGDDRFVRAEHPDALRFSGIQPVQRTPFTLAELEDGPLKDALGELVEAMNRLFPKPKTFDVLQRISALVTNQLPGYTMDVMLNDKTIDRAKSQQSGALSKFLAQYGEQHIELATQTRIANPAFAELLAERANQAEQARQQEKDSAELESLAAQQTLRLRELSFNLNFLKHRTGQTPEIPGAFPETLAALLSQRLATGSPIPSRHKPVEGFSLADLRAQDEAIAAFHAEVEAQVKAFQSQADETLARLKETLDAAEAEFEEDVLDLKDRLDRKEISRQALEAQHRVLLEGITRQRLAYAQGFLDATGIAGPGATVLSPKQLEARGFKLKYDDKAIRAVGYFHYLRHHSPKLKTIYPTRKEARQDLRRNYEKGLLDASSIVASQDGFQAIKRFDPGWPSLQEADRLQRPPFTPLMI